MEIKLQKGFSATNEEKKKKENTENVVIFKNSAELYYSYFAKILEENLDLKNYNEFIFNDKYSKLVFDIDLKNTDLYSDFGLEEKQNSPLTVLQQLIKDFISFMNKNQSQDVTINYNSNSEIMNIKDLNNNQIYDSIFKKVAITKSNNSSKLSYHIIFNNIIYKTNISNKIKKFITLFQKKSNNPLSKYIDLQIYRNNSMLRLIYCTKDDTDKSYHEPLEIIEEKDEYLIENNVREINEKNLEEYLFTYITNINNNIFEIEEVQEIGNLELDHLDLYLGDNTETFYDENLRNKPDIHYLSFKRLLYQIFKETDLAILTSTDALKNYSFFKQDISIKDYKEHIYLIFDYEKTVCQFCKKKSHKHKHRIFFTEEGIVVKKEGRTVSCKIKAYRYPQLSDYDICEWIFKKGNIKRLDTDELVCFSKSHGWKLLSTYDYSSLKLLMSEYGHEFKFIDQYRLRIMNEKTMKEFFKAFTKGTPIAEIKYHNLFKFNNGILNLKTDEFIPMAESKEFFVFNQVNYDYKFESEYNEEEKNKAEYINTVIDQIMPKMKNGVENGNRKVFEQNLSTCIILNKKPVITVFQGNTSAGKSTIKNLISSTLGINNYIELPIITYTSKQTFDPTKPNPWLGKCSYKLVSFSSETFEHDVVNTQTIKLLTEPEIQARTLNSNDCSQNNCLTQFIDTNFTLKFDKQDLAAMRRWAVVYFDSYFKSTTNALDVGSETNNHYLNETLKTDILNKNYALQFFNILKSWGKKYNQFEQLTMLDTSDNTDYFKFFKFFTENLISTNYIKTEFIKDEEKKNYTFVKYIKDYSTEKSTFFTPHPKFLTTRLKLVAEKKKWEIDTGEFIHAFRTRIKNYARKSFIFRYVFLIDIKEDKFEELMEYTKQVYNMQNQDNKLTKEYNFKPFLENKEEFTELLTSSINEEDEEDEEEVGKNKYLTAFQKS